MAYLPQNLIKDRNSVEVQKLTHGIRLWNIEFMEYILYIMEYRLSSNVNGEKTEASWTMHPKVFWPKVLRGDVGDASAGMD